MKRSIKTVLTFVLLVVMAISCFTFVACSEEQKSGETNQADVKVTLNDEEIVLAAGSTKVIKAVTDPSGVRVNWSSSNESVATVSAIGKITAVSAGEAVITASAGKGSDTCKVIVRNVEVSMEQTSATINYSETNKLQLTATDSNGIGKYTWTSSDPEIAEVNSSGLVTAKKPGTVVISAAIGASSASCTVEVVVPSDFYTMTSAKNDEVAVNPDKWYYYSSLTTDIYGYYADGKATFVSNNSKASQTYLRYSPSGLEDGTVFSAEITVTIDVDAYVRLGASVGKSEIVFCEAGTHTLKYNNRTAAPSLVLSVALLKSEASSDFLGGPFVITCSDPVISKKFGILPSSVTMTIDGEPVPLKVNDGTQARWSTSDETVATVDEEGVVTPVGLGDCTITAVSGENTATCKVSVVSKTITFGTPYSVVRVGETANVDAVVSDGAVPVYTSENDAVATVDDNGKISAVGVGYTVVNVESEGIVAKYEVCVVSDDTQDLSSVEDGMKEAKIDAVCADPGTWYYNTPKFDTYSMLDGVITMSAPNATHETDYTQTMLRVLPKIDGSVVSGKFIIVATITNNTVYDSEDLSLTGLKYSVNAVNGNTAASGYVAAGESVTFIAVVTIKDPSLECLNVKISNHGKGTVVLSDIHFIKI